MDINFLLNSGTTSYQKAVHKAVLDTLGDPRQQTNRYVASAMDPMTNDALRKDLTRHSALQALLWEINPTAIMQDIMTTLKMLLGPELVALLDLQAGPSLDYNRIFDFAYKAAAATSDTDAAVILANKCPQLRFRYHPQADTRGELIELLDAQLNAVIIKHIMQGLHKLILSNIITPQVCMDITDHFMADGALATDPIHINALQKTFQRLSMEHPQHPIIYLSIGCGNGHADIKIVNELRATLPDIKIDVIGFDPFQKEPEKNDIVTILGGKLINRELGPDETFISLVRDITGIKDIVVVATERFAMHHMGRSTARMMLEIAGATLISVEEPVTALQRTDMPHRCAACGYDALANYARETRFGGNWIAQALAKPELFGSHYRRWEDLETHIHKGIEVIKVPQVYPATAVIIYPATHA